MQLFKRLWFPLALTLIGVITILAGISLNQNMSFMVGAFAMLVAGAIGILTTTVDLNKTLRWAVSSVLVVMVIGLGYADYMSIKVDIDLKNEKNRRYEHVIQRLKDIRTAELAYKSRYHKYTGSFDTLRTFLTEGSLLVIKAIGDVPDTMSLEDAVKAGIAKRDTIYVPVLDSLFGERHLKDRVHSFHVDSLPFVPFERGTEFKIEAGVVTRSNVKVPVFQVTDSKPFDKNHVLQVGSMNDPKTNGNWE